MLAGFLLFLLLAWKLSFSSTFALRSEIETKQKKILWLQEKEKELPFLKAKMDLVERSYGRDSAAIRDQLTAFVSDFAENNDCLVTEIPSYTAYKNNNLQVQTNIFTVKGRFHPLLRLVQEVEGRFRANARLMSVRFMTVKDHQTKRKDLYLTLITQSFKQTNAQHE